MHNSASVFNATKLCTQKYLRWQGTWLAETAERVCVTPEPGVVNCSPALGIELTSKNNNK